MSVDVDRIPRRAPGPQARVNWSHPLAAGLVAFASPANRRDHVTGHPLTVGGVSDGVGVFGRGSTGYTPSAYWLIGSGALLGPCARYSVFAGCRGPASGHGNGRAIYCERAATGNDILKMEVTNSGALQCTYRDDAGVLIQSAAATDIRLRQFVGGQVRTSLTTFESWLDGAKDGTHSNGAMTAAFTNANLERRIGADPADSVALDDGLVMWVACWTRALSPAEIAALTFDPFAMLEVD